MDDRPEWFAPKRFGYGSGLPISWQGWATLIGYLVVVGIEALLLRGSGAMAIIAAAVPPTLAFILVSARTTRGGWRWRWGRSDSD